MTSAILPQGAHQPAGCKLEHKTIGSLRGQFFVPAYQRGYRWGADDVGRLLDDIWESEGREYSLQPVVVKLHAQGDREDTHEWELIDGQQRLTTLYVIFRYIQQQGWKKHAAPFSLRYETRDDSATYLQALGADPGQDAAKAKQFIDYHHLFQAYCKVADWFAARGDADDVREDIAGILSRALYKSVRVIWYEAPPSVSATALFTRLNVGRIPLTDAELIKAALLSRIRASVSIDRAQEIAAQWDGIERELQRPDIWAFVSGLSSSSDNTDHPTRISLLLDALADHTAGTSPGKRPRYYTFNALRADIDSIPLEMWQRVVSLHAQVIGWFGNASQYNKIGFLVASAEASGEFGHIAMAAQGRRKRDFDDFLVARIRDRLDTRKDSLDDLQYTRGSDRDLMRNLLLLMNVEATSRTRQHFPFDRHLGPNWSLEHIHAQNPESLKTAEQWRTWLESHAIALDAVRSLESDASIQSLLDDMREAVGHIQQGNAKAFSGKEFAELSNRVLKLLDRDTGPDHSLRNMALLSSDHNSKLNNAVFEVKRQRILSLDREGEYVPICTRNVFLKYYANADAQQPHFWSEQDKAAYLEAMSGLLDAYLKQGHA